MRFILLQVVPSVRRHRRSNRWSAGQTAQSSDAVVGIIHRAVFNVSSTVIISCAIVVIARSVRYPRSRCTAELEPRAARYALLCCAQAIRR